VSLLELELLTPQLFSGVRVAQSLRVCVFVLLDLYVSVCSCGSIFTCLCVRVAQSLDVCVFVLLNFYVSV
jgi:hypothetical protein